MVEKNTKSMLFRNNLPVKFNWLVVSLFVSLGFLVTFSISCSAQPSEKASLSTLRRLTKGGNMPAESIVANVESRFAGTKTGALARLLRARILSKNGDKNGAARLLESNIFEEKTGVADYALWLRGNVLREANRIAESNKVFEELVQKYPNSMRVRNARLLWAYSLMQSGQNSKTADVLKSLIKTNDPDALMIMAKGFEKGANQPKSVEFYRRSYFYGAGSKVGSEAEEWLKENEQDMNPRSSDEILARANLLFRKKRYRESASSFDTFARVYSRQLTNEIKLKRTIAFAKSRQMAQAKFAFNSIPISAKEKPEGYYQLALGYAKARQWTEARSTVNELRQKFRNSECTPKAMIDVGMTARDQRRKLDESYFLKSAVNFYPNAIDVTKAQFELAWLEHLKKNYQVSSRMLTEHLARYVHKDNSYRGQTGYWAARDSEYAGKLREACALYDASAYRYGANWYGYLALKRLQILRRSGKCRTSGNFPAGSLVSKAVANMKVVTVAAETATQKELDRAEKSEELSTVGLFDWAIEELREAKKTANNSPKINLALAKHYRLKSDNVRALLALKNSYPDYSQMFPEEMGREEWDIFYPLVRWNQIKYWANKRRLDPYQVAGLIRQETIFDPNAKSSANAYGLMQLLVPTARTMARKYSSTSASSIYGSTLFNTNLNIELGTAYMREQLNKYGRIEYMSVAYNAGPGRVVRWRRDLPLQMDEFVEAIPFRETKGYVKGIIRNSAQYRRLYDMAGNFKPNVGTKPLRGQIDSKPAEQFAQENPEILVERDRKLAK